MGKIAFVFPGQGAQYPGMGKDLCDHLPSAAASFAALDALRPGTSEQCFFGSEEELTETANTQPCMFAVEWAAAKALRDAGVACDMTAGFSLGEIAALTYAGVVTAAEGFGIVTTRGQLMQSAAEAVNSGMIAVLKLAPKTVEELCSHYDHVYPVNYNCPGQLVVAGLEEELSLFAKEVKTAGGRGLPLKVKGAFHTPLMESAAASFAEVLAAYPMKAAEIPLYANYSGERYADAGTAYREGLSKQISHAVRWQQCVESMITAGADTFIELGPKTTLCGLIKKINGDVRTLHVEDYKSFQETLAEVKSC
ncbi:MAG TPA: ACP S-malonyltransferase [Clostridiales bacterium]|nr:ACP S-malonyltransferase [Clostridiales bacterium]